MFFDNVASAAVHARAPILQSAGESDRAHNHFERDQLPSRAWSPSRYLSTCWLARSRRTAHRSRAPMPQTLAIAATIGIIISIRPCTSVAVAMDASNTARAAIPPRNQRAWRFGPLPSLRSRRLRLILLRTLQGDVVQDRITTQRFCDVYRTVRGHPPPRHAFAPLMFAQIKIDPNSTRA
jgi:hypothetical protein